MTAKEIREMYLGYGDVNEQAITNEGAHVVAEEAAVHMLFEIAAQLAELNANLGEINSALWRRAPVNPDFVGEFGKGSDYR